MMEMAVPIDTGFAVEIHAEWTMPHGDQNRWLRPLLERLGGGGRYRSPTLDDQ